MAATGQPVGLTRVSPGVYRNRRGNLVNYNPPRSTTNTNRPGNTNPGNQGNNNQGGQNNNNQGGQTNNNTNRTPTYTIAPPQGLRAENLPTFNLLNDRERREYLRIRQTDPRAALRWMQERTRGRQPQPTPEPEPTPEPTPETTPVTTEDPTPTEAQPTQPSYDFNSYQSPMTKALLEAMGQGMSTMQAYEPQSFEGSPLYQFQRQKGLADLEKLMAARGLTGSGAEIQGNSDFLAQLNATEAEKQRQYAEANRDRQQRAMEFIADFDRSEREALRNQWNTDLDRQTNISQFEAGRGDARQQSAVNFLTNLLNIQSNNDIARLSQAGMGSQTDLTKALINAMTQNTMNQVSRPSGGGGATPPPPQPGNMTDLYRILMDYGNRGGNNDLINGLFRMIGG